jgi:hypothetical protein
MTQARRNPVRCCPESIPNFLRARLVQNGFYSLSRAKIHSSDKSMMNPHMQKTLWLHFLRIQVEMLDHNSVALANAS